MVSLRQIEANCRNALKSTGPKTEAGKQVSRCNAVRHGLTAEAVIGKCPEFFAHLVSAERRRALVQAVMAKRNQDSKKEPPALPICAKDKDHDALERGLVATNAVRSMKRERTRRSKREQKQKLKVGVDIPTPDEIKKYRPLLLTAIFTGLRASELRGFVDLKHAKLHVRQRADRYNKIDKPKSESSERTVPLMPMVANTLREWKFQCPKGEHGKLEYVFPTGTGEIEYHSNILQRGLEPAQIAA